MTLDQYSGLMAKVSDVDTGLRVIGIMLLIIIILLATIVARGTQERRKK